MNLLSRIVLHGYEQYLSRLIKQASLRADGPFISGRVAHCAFSLGGGGAERQLTATVQGLSGRGLSQDIICNSLAHEEDRHYLPLVTDFATNIFDLTKLMNEADMEDTRRRLPAMRLLPGPFRKRVLCYAHVLERQRPGIVHVWSDNIHAAFSAALIGIPRIIISWRNISPADWSHEGGIPLKERMRLLFLYAAYRALARLPSVRLVNNSLAGGDSYARWLRLPRERIGLLYNGISGNEWQEEHDSPPVPALPFQIPPGTPVIAGLMRFASAKRPMVWLEVAEHVVRRKKAMFVLFGDGPMRSRMESFILSRGLQNDIFLPGKLRDVRRAYSAADLFLLTSSFEGLPNVLLEAQMMGTPVVTTAAGGAAEAVDDGGSGLVLPLDASPRDIADAIVRVLDDDTWRQTAKVKGREFVLSRFGIDRLVDETLALYACAAGNGQ